MVEDTVKFIWVKNYGIVTFLLIVFGLGIGITAYFTISNEYLPSSKTVVFSNATIDSIQNGTKVSKKIFDVGIAYDKNIFISALNFINPKTTTISAFFYVEQRPLNIKNILLSSSNSVTSLNTPSSLPSFEKITKNNKEVWSLSTTVGHTLRIQNSTADYNIFILYRTDPSDSGPVHLLTIPIQLAIRTMDLSVPVYFWIIFSGVILSRVFSYSSNTTESESNKKLQLNKIDLLWVPFSAVITLLIFVSFKEQITLTDDLLTNLALAFGFGFGFDKVFETLQKR